MAAPTILYSSHTGVPLNTHTRPVAAETRQDIEKAVAAMPRLWRNLVRVILLRGAADLVTVCSAPQNGDPARFGPNRNAVASERVVYRRRLNSELPQASASVNARMQALSDALADAGIFPLASVGLDAETTSAGFELHGFCFVSQRLDTPGPIELTTHAVTSSNHDTHGEHAPDGWDLYPEQPKDFTAAVLTLPLPDRQRIEVRCGESPNSLSAVLKASHIFESASPAVVDISRTLSGIPHLFTDATADSLRTAKTQNDVVDITIDRRSAPVLAERAIANGTTSSLVALQTRLRDATEDEVVTIDLRDHKVGVHSVARDVYEGLESRSTVHQLYATDLCIGPVVRPQHAPTPLLRQGNRRDNYSDPIFDSSALTKASDSAHSFERKAADGQ